MNSHMAMDRPSDQELNLFEGRILGKCHKVEAFLGEGNYGVVTKCCNTQTNQIEAVKVNKSHPDMIWAAQYEIGILKQLQRLDPDACNIVKWDGFFFDRENICLTFELLDQSLKSYMEDREYQPLPMAQIRDVLYQLATGLSHLRSAGIVHADIKPDNIMLVDHTQQSLKVKMIDFGVACRVSDIKPGDRMGTPWYMAPEVILQCPFNEAIDMWSLGMVAVELATGYTLYPGNKDYDVLRYVIDAQGQIPDSVLDKAMGAEEFFERQWNGEQHWRFKSPEEYEFETGYQATDTRYVWLDQLDYLEQLMENSEGSQSDRHLLVDLIKGMLQLDPEQRIKPQEVLQHPFFGNSSPQNSSAEMYMQTADEMAKEHKRAADSEQPSCSHMEQPNSLHCKGQNTQHSQAAEDLKKVNEMEAQHETNHQNNSWFKSFMKAITDTVYSYFPWNR